MNLTISNYSINVHYNEAELKEKIPILFLHGFTGCLEDWEFLKGQLPKKYSPVFIDLLGHGKSSAPKVIEEYSEKSQVELLNLLLKKLSISKLVLVGYSMGGRLALAFTIKYPHKIAALILESTSFGLETKNERNERIESDKNISKQIENSTINNFVNYWMGLPLFSSQKKSESQKVIELKQRKIFSNNLIGLKNSLLGFSSGKMNNYFPQLKDINIKVLLISGELDLKYNKINIKADSLLPNSKLIVVKNCGHNVHFEKPKEFIKFLNKFLLNIRINK